MASSTTLSTAALRPAQGKLTDNEITCLKKLIPMYLARPEDKSKGAKVKWIREKILPRFAQEFKSGAEEGPDIGSLEKVCFAF